MQTKTMLQKSEEIRTAGARLASGKSFVEMFEDMINSISKPEQDKQQARKVLQEAKRQFGSIQDEHEQAVKISNYCNKEQNGAPLWARQKAIEAYRSWNYQNNTTFRIKASAHLASSEVGTPDAPAWPQEQVMEGGKGDKLTPADVDPIEFDLGMEMEKEHTADEATRQEMVLDHLAEDPAYYSKLKQMEGQGVDVQMFGEMRATKL